MPTDPRDLRADAPLLDAWLRFQEGAPTPFTIPGHKQRHDLVGDVVAGDVPLYGGLDTMKLSTGVLAEAEARAARWWNADLCRFSVGGSTHGNQALALAVARAGRGRRVVVSRTLHRSLFLGLVLAGLDPVWVRPDIDPGLGIPLGVSAATIERTLTENPEVAAVFVGDPSYVGTVGDLPTLVATAHARGVPVIVDAAWAPHFGFHPALPAHAMAAGADAMVISAHKALPAWSQAALVLAQEGGLLGLTRHSLDAAVEATATTSPTGAILASIDAARALLERDGAELLGSAMAAVAAARAALRTVPGLVVLEGAVVDPLKLALLLADTGADGNAVEQDLLAAGLPVEMADRDQIVAQVSLADDAANLGPLVETLSTSIARHRGASRAFVSGAAWAVDPVTAVSPREAFFASATAVPRHSAEGRVCAELIAPYPPGVPVVAPGELVTSAVQDGLDAPQRSGIRIAYAADPTLGTIRVLD